MDGRGDKGAIEKKNKGFEIGGEHGSR